MFDSCYSLIFIVPQFVICYDISDDHRREKVARVLLRYGERAQKSVYVAYLEAEEHAELRRELGAVLRTCDALEIFPVDLRAGQLHVAWHAEPHHSTSVRVITR